MAGKKQLAITERQFAVLDLLWEHGPMTVRDVLARLPGGRGLPYTTVLGLLQGMERSGLVAHGGEQPELALRVLKRYTTEAFADAVGWRAWLDKTRDRLFFTDTGGYKFMARPRD